MFFFLSTIYLFFYFSRNLFYNFFFFYIFYLTSILFFLIIKKDIFDFFLKLSIGSALIIIFVIALGAIIHWKKNNNYLFFQCPWLLQKAYEYLYNFFFPVKTIEPWDPFVYRKEIEPCFTFLNPESEPDISVQGSINYGRRLISQVYDGSNFEPTSYEQSVEIVESLVNTNLETQTIFIIWSVGRRLVQARRIIRR